MVASRRSTASPTRASPRKPPPDSPSTPKMPHPPPQNGETTCPALPTNRPSAETWQSILVALAKLSPLLLLLIPSYREFLFGSSHTSAMGTHLSWKNLPPKPSPSPSPVYAAPPYNAPLSPAPDDDDEILCDCAWTRYKGQSCSATRGRENFPCWTYCCAPAKDEV